jgi:hypothetical protein
VATSDAGGGLVLEQLGSGQAKIAFDAPHDVERWDVRGRRGDVEVFHFVYETPEREEEDPETTSSVESTGNSERSVLLAVEREGRIFAVDSAWSFLDGDRVAAAIHLPEREDAFRELATQGWVTAPLDEAPGEEAIGAKGAVAHA